MQAYSQGVTHALPGVGLCPSAARGAACDVVEHILWELGCHLRSIYRAMPSLMRLEALSVPPRA